MSGPCKLRLEYRFSLRDGRERHDWNLIGEAGAVNVWAEPATPGYGDRWIGGVECHYAAAPDHAAYCGHRENCWLLGKECWHDGSSLQFAEQIEPRLPEPTGKQMDAWTAEMVEPLLRNRFRLWLTPETEGVSHD